MADILILKHRKNKQPFLQNYVPKLDASLNPNISQIDTCPHLSFEIFGLKVLIRDQGIFSASRISLARQPENRAIGYVAVSPPTSIEPKSERTLDTFAGSKGDFNLLLSGYLHSPATIAPHCLLPLRY
jgi:hypothetical protein